MGSAMFRTGTKPVVTVETDEGYMVRLTADHQIYSQQRGWMQARSLHIGEAIRVRHQTGGFGYSGSLKDGQILGWMVAEGAEEFHHNVMSGMPVANYLEGHHDVSGQAAYVAYARSTGLQANKLQVPDGILVGNEDMQRGFLQAIFEANGGVQLAEPFSPQVYLNASSRKLLQETQQVLLNFSLYSRIEMGTDLELHDRNHASQFAQPLYRLVIEGDSLGGFMRYIGFLSESRETDLRVAWDLIKDTPHHEEWVAHVRRIYDDGVEDVYDLTEPSTHAFSANGLIVHNCAEQPLPAWGVCTLGHVNLAAFYREETKDVDWSALRVTVRMGTRFLDDIVDATPYFFDQNYQNQQRERRIGLGTMGLGELLIRLGLRYGSPESIAFIDKLYEFIATEAYLYDVELAKEKGQFPAFDAEKYLESGFMQRLPETVRGEIRQHGTRNVTILTQAPTGTVGSMVGTSTGIEPFYALTYYRQSRLGFDEQYVEVAQEWIEAHPGEELPSYFVGAMDLTPEEHIYVQAAIQRWTDSSISKTANAPSTYTMEDTARLYELAYDLGCKGVTIYRDQSRQEQVLHLADNNKAESTEVASPVAYLDTGADVEVYPVPAQVNGRTYRKETPAGTARVVINEVDGNPFEVFMLLGRAGSEVQSFMEALGRIISLYLRSNGNVSPRRRIELVSEQLKGIGGANQMGFGPGRVLSVVDGIGKLLESYLSQGRGTGVMVAEPQSVSLSNAPERRATQQSYDLCPQCDAPTLIYEEGCQHCTSCGYSKC